VEGRLSTRVRTALWRHRSVAITMALGALLAVACWPVPEWTTWGPGLDASWLTALHLAIQDGLHFGHDIVFSYGPLGFLLFPTPYFGWTSAVALAFVAIVYWLLACTLLGLARTVLPLWAAGLVAFLGLRVTPLIGAAESLEALAFLGAVYLLASAPPWSQRAVTAAVCGAVGGVALLGKANAGVVIAAVMIITASQLLRPWWRGLAIGGASMAAAFVASWIVLGQRLTDVVPWARLTYDLIAGYSSAMSTFPGPSGAPATIAAASMFAALLAGLWLVGRELPRSNRKAILLIGAIVGFSVFKEAFVRWHYATWFAVATLLAFSLALGRVRWHLLVASLATCLAALVLFVGVSPARLLDPVTPASNAASQWTTVIDPAKRHAAYEQTTRRMQMGYRLDPAFLAAVGKNTVHIDPWEAGVAFAFRQLNWHPLPIFQSYAAYTTALDEANAAVLRSSNAPERLIRMPPVAIDERFPWFEPPTTMVEMICRYEQLRGALFGRIPSRCGPIQRLGTVSASVGQTIDVPVDPRPDRMIVASFDGVASSPLERVITLLWKGDPWYITLNGTSEYRLVPGTAPDLHVLSTPATLDWAAPFAFPAPTRTIEITAGADGHSSSDHLTIRFYSIAVAAP
jgi:hypothetical protein